jgi:hypothetical protein
MYINQTAPGLSSTQILMLLTNTFSSINNGLLVTVIDNAVIQYHNITIPVAQYSILVNGISWYNNQGYISPNYENEKRENAKLIQSKFQDLYPNLPSHNVDIQPTMTVQQVVIQWALKLRDPTVDPYEKESIAKTINQII